MDCGHHTALIVPLIKRISIARPSRPRIRISPYQRRDPMALTSRKLIRASPDTVSAARSIAVVQVTALWSTASISSRTALTTCEVSERIYISFKPEIRRFGLTYPLQVTLPFESKLPAHPFRSHDCGFPHVLVVGLHWQVAKLPLQVALPLESKLPSHPLRSQD